MAAEQPAETEHLVSRNVLSWRRSNNLDTELCLDALEMSLAGGRKPKIFHSDRDCRFTSSDFVSRLQAEKIMISCSGRKRCYNNILVERLWRTVKYVAEGFSAKPSRGITACIQRSMGGLDQLAPIALNVVAGQATRLSR